MKKLIVALLLVAAALSYGMEIKRHWLEPGVGLNYGMQDKLTTMEMSIPYVKHDFKAILSPMFTMYMVNGLSYKMTSFALDGTSADESQTDFDLSIAPGFEMNLPNDMYIYVEPSYNMNNESNAGGAKIDGVTSTQMNLYASLSYDLTSTRMHLLSPWDYFKDQYAVGIAYGTDLYSKYGDFDAAEEHDGYIRLYGEYNYLNKDMNMMISPNGSYEMHMNDKISEASIIDLNVAFAKDFTEQFNMDGTIGMNMNKANSDADMVNNFGAKVMANYFPIVPLRIGAGFGIEQDMTTDDAKAKISLMITAGYRLDFTK